VLGYDAMRAAAHALTRHRQVAGFALASFAGALVLRGVNVGQPNVFVFDEIYYANDALDLLTRGAERAFAAHPPLGKWLLALGISIGGFDPTAWRMPAVLCGAVTVSLVYLCAARVTGSPRLSLLASVLVLTDGIAFTTSRLALLDGFAAMATTALIALLLLTSDSKKVIRIAVAAGLLAGAAAAIKWTALPVLPVAAGVCGLRAGRQHRGASVAAACVALVVALAVVAYAASYSGWLVGGARFGDCSSNSCSGGVVDRLTDLPHVQDAMLEYGLNLDRVNPQLAPGWRWLLQDRPTVLFADDCRGAADPACVPGATGPITIEAAGSPVLWWTSLPCLCLVLFDVRRRRARLPGVSDARLVAISAVVLWAPWALSSSTYTFYAAPIVPCLAITAVVVIRTYVPARAVGLAGAAVAVLAIASFALTWPQLVG